LKSRAQVVEVLDMACTKIAICVHWLASAWLLVAATGLWGAADTVPLHEVTALSLQVGYRIRLTDVQRGKSARDGSSTLSVNFRLEFPGTGPTNFTRMRPEGVFLEGATSLIAAITATGPRVLFGYAYGQGDRYSGTTISYLNMEVEEEYTQLHQLGFAVTLVKVTEWEELAFKNLTLGTNGFLHCGPFDLLCIGELTRFKVSAAAFSMFEEEHKNYRDRVPLGFLNHSYAMDYLSIVDANDRQYSTSVRSVTGGSSHSAFYFGKSPDFGAKAGEKAPAPARPVVRGGLDGEEIAYPMTIRLKLPKRYEKEQVKFQIEKIELPPAKPR
jgi:hypothetical protein